MGILIDTPVFLWAAAMDGRLSNSAKRLLEDPEQAVFFSAASSWEIALKYARGRLTLPGKPGEIINRIIAAAGMTRLAISIEDSLELAELPLHHKDPFDRLLVVQARKHGLRLMTANPILERYDVDVIALWLDDDDE